MHLGIFEQPEKKDFFNNLLEAYSMADKRLPVVVVLGLRTPMGPGDYLLFNWHNFYYPKDPVTLGKPLTTSSFPGVKNHKLSAGETFAVSHTSYRSPVLIASAVYKLSRGSP